MADENKKLNYEYIRGLVEGEGSFTFSTNSSMRRDGTIVRRKTPAFAIGMNERDEQLLVMVRDTLGLRNRVYNYKDFHKDGYKRGRKAFLIVREFGQLKNIVIPFFYNKLRGYKAKQFEEWLERIGSDHEVSRHFKLLYKLHKSGWYERNMKRLCEEVSLLEERG